MAVVERWPLVEAQLVKYTGSCIYLTKEMDNL